MNEDQADEVIKLLKGIDWKLWEMYNMIKDVLATDDTPNDLTQEDDDND